MHIRFGDYGRWEISAPTNAIGETSVRDHILTYLKVCKAWKTTKHITAALIEPTYNLKSIQNALSLIAQEKPCPMAIQRRPGRGRPKEYHCMAPTFDVQPDDYSQQSGNKGREQSTYHNDYTFPPESLNGTVREGIDEIQQRANEAHRVRLLAKWNGEVN
jgi:hypothetical protein